jgi:hypothetical protein
MSDISQSKKEAPKKTNPSQQGTYNFVSEFTNNIKIDQWAW